MSSSANLPRLHRLRVAVGIAGLMLFFVPWVHSWYTGSEVLGSYSVHYYTTARPAFSGILMVIGFFLIVDSGFIAAGRSPSTRRLQFAAEIFSDVTGVAAILVALIPTSPPCPDIVFGERCHEAYTLMTWIDNPKAHYGAAIAFVVGMFVVSLFFWLPEVVRRTCGTPRRNLLAVLSGGILLGGAVSLASQVIESSVSLILVGEAISSFCFSFAWLVAASPWRVHASSTGAAGEATPA